MAIEQNSNVPNDAMGAFFAEMEKKIPADMVVTSMSVDSDAISLSLSCASKESAAEALMQMREFETIDNVVCSGISEEEADSGQKKVTFSVTATYRVAEPEDTEQTEDTQTADTQAE